MPRPVVLATAIALLAVGSAPDAQRVTSTFQLHVDGPLRVGGDLKRAAADGYTCAAVAQPVPPLRPINVAVIMGRRADVAAGSAGDIEVVVPRSVPIEAFDEAVSRVAAKGYRMCGLTIALPVQGLPTTHIPVAVMTRIAAGESAPEYRVIRTRGRQEERDRLGHYGAEGYAVTHLVARPLSESSDESVVIFVLEKHAGSQPLDYRTAFGGNASTLQTSIETFAKAGRRVQAAWSSNARVDVLMSKPLEGTWPGEREYVVTDPSSFRISSFDGALLRMLRPRDAFIGIYDKRIKREHTVTSGEIADPVTRPFLDVKSETWMVEKLDGDGGRGYWPLDFTLRPGKGQVLLADVILERH
jgi:hypothetical protein